MGAKILYGLLVLLTLAVLGLVALNSAECTKVSVEEIEAKIARDLPLGTDDETVVRWLEENDIELRVRGLARDHIGYPDYGIPPEATIIIAAIEDSGWEGLLYTKSIIIYFVLDDEDRLIDAVVEEELAGP